MISKTNKKTFSLYQYKNLNQQTQINFYVPEHSNKSLKLTVKYPDKVKERQHKKEQVHNHIKMSNLLNINVKAQRLTDNW